jgi:hypothetical protein
MHPTPASTKHHSLFDLVRSFDHLLGTSVNQFDTTPEFVANIFSSILYQVRRAEQTPVRQVTISLPQQEITPQVSKGKTKSPPPTKKQPLPRKPKHQKAADKAAQAQLYAQHVQKWQNPNHIEPPPSYSICRNQPTTAAPLL